MLPLGDDLESGRGRPYLTLGLVCLLLAVYGYTSTLSENERATLVQGYGLIPVRLLEDPGSAWLSLFSYIFLHGSLLHVLGNGLFLWVFGRALERELHWFFLPVFLVLGAAAGLGTAVLRADAAVPTIGASGAISGIIGAYLVLFPEAGVRLLVVAWAVPAMLLRIGSPILDIPAWIFIAFWFGLQIFGGLGAQFSPSGIDYGAHLAGFFAGYGLIRLLRASLGFWPDHEVARVGWDPLRQPPRGRKGAYLAADRPLPEGHVLRREDLTVVKPAAGLVNPDSIAPRDRPRILGRALLVERFRYEPVLWSDLADHESGKPPSLDGSSQSP